MSPKRKAKSQSTRPPAAAKVAADNQGAESKYHRLEQLLTRLRNCTLYVEGRREHPLEAKRNRQLLLLQKKYFPRQKKDVPFEELMKIEEVAVLEASFREQAKKLQAKVRLMQEQLSKEIDELVGQLDPPKTDELQLFFTASEYEFSSQTRPAAYAECKAKLYAEAAKRLGLVTDVRRHAEPSNYAGGGRSYVSGSYQVFVGSTTPVGKAIVDRRQLPLRDTLQFILQNTCNVRVFFPLLPYGLEEKLGLDAWGNDTKGKTDVQNETNDPSGL